MKLAWSVQRRTTALPTSAGRPRRLIGVHYETCCVCLFVVCRVPEDVSEFVRRHTRSKAGTVEISLVGFQIREAGVFAKAMK